ncbi:hypothetical protein E0Z10_g123 [Xylaria hypoxylon]|uniref:Uncharacterized protein n=1 Tax=Xylaria hypoxylon TaxID=37992 RepID=A0A4Z0ZAC6_9PEZI|nr:hypothetical protein E0Z10_g123 [Xylaria hypoxylon]
MKASEEKIPVHSQAIEVYFVVNCPSLHIIQLGRLGPRKESTSSTGLSDFEYSPSLCPACGQIITKSRQIPSLCFAPTGSPITSDITLTPPLPLERFDSPWQAASSQYPPRYIQTSPESVSHNSSSSFTTYSRIRNPPSPTLPEPISSLSIIDSHLAQFRSTTPSRPPSRAPTAPPEQKRNGLFNIKWPGSKMKPERKNTQPRSMYSQESNESGLPKFMSFTFALTGRTLLLWKKDGETLVRIGLEAPVHQSIGLDELLPGGAIIDRSASIRFAVEGSEWISAIVAHNIANQRRLSLFVVHCSGLPERSSVYPLDDHTEPRCLAISLNNAFIAVGFGTKVLLLHYQGTEQQWLRVLHIPELTNPSAARFQVISFSGDSSCLAVSTQKRDAARSEDDDVVFTHVWRCDPGSNSPLTLWSCKMPTDGQGLTTIHFHPVLATGLITGLTTTSYPLFIAPRDRPLPPTPSSSIPDFRIRCSTARLPPHGHQIYLLDQRNRVLCADLQAQNVRVIADLNTPRGALKPQEEPAVMGISESGRLRVFWRQGAGLYVVEIETRERMGIGRYLDKEDVSWRWFDAIGAS